MPKRNVERLLAFALDNGLIGSDDTPYCRNLLMDMLGFAEPWEGYDAFAPRQDGRDGPAQTAGAYLSQLCDYAAQSGIISPDTAQNRALFSSRLMGVVTLAPSVLAERFAHIAKWAGPQAATDWFYKYCRACDYIRVDAIAKNVAFKALSPVGELDITINLSKPEKDPRDIAAEREAKPSGYPACLLCPDNTGHAGGPARPGRQNHRMLPITLGGQSWRLQYSPYLYYNEHCIALNDRHIPMAISRATFERLFDFADQFPHYFMGSNADLPIVGGSILTHDHFQGGRYEFPMDRAGDRTALANTRFTGVRASLVSWPMTCLRLRGRDRAQVAAMADSILCAWRAHNDRDAGIIAETGREPHNTITPIARKEGGAYLLNLVLRNNRVSREYPLGVFHPHEDLHHIKKENIGLIEVMGLFILPGRLKDELNGVMRALCGEGDDKCPEAHLPWLYDMRQRHGTVSRDEAEETLRRELAIKCARVLTDAGVYKQTDAGLSAFMRFWAAWQAAE